MINLFGNFKIVIVEFHKNGKNGISLRLRLLAFLSVLVFTNLLTYLIILMVIGVFNDGKSESRKLIAHELLDFNKDVDADFNKLSRQGILLSKQLTCNISQILLDHDLSYHEIQKNPKMIETVLGSQVDTLLLSLQTAKSSGIYIILDCTVNELAKEADVSRACLFLKNTQPNILTSVEANIQYLNGPITIAQTHGIELMPQWNSEFPTGNCDFYKTVINNSKKRDLPLSNLYYWSKPTTSGASSESRMLLVVPMVAEDGTVYGTCGFEVSSTMFKQAYSPNNVVSPHLFAILSLIDEQTFTMNTGLIAGNYDMAGTYDMPRNYDIPSNYDMDDHLTDRSITIAVNPRTLYNYSSKEGQKFHGLHQSISLYPSTSIYANDTWIVGILLPKEALSATINSKNKIIVASFVLLFMFEMLLATIISCKYIKPITKALNVVKTNGYSSKNKTKILEIDDLLEYLSKQDEKSSVVANKSISYLAHNTATFENFEKNIKTLSPAEKAVFDLYLKGYTAKEITEILFLSINTIKTHSKRIYEKLNVSSRKELLIYFTMMEEIPPEESTHQS